MKHDLQHELRSGAGQPPWRHTDAAAGEDDALLRRMAVGDESALAALYDRCAGRIHSLAHGILRDPDEAEDVVEETFWQAWRTAGRYDSRRAPGLTWLLMIARSRALDRLRRRRRQETWQSRNGAMIPDDHTAATDLEAGADAGLLAEALAILPAEQRQTVELAFFGGLSHAEIAARMSQPLGTVKTRIRLAMQKLRQRLSYLAEDRP